MGGGFGVSRVAGLGLANFSPRFSGFTFKSYGFHVLRRVTGCGFGHFYARVSGTSFEIPIFRVFEVVASIYTFFYKKLVYKKLVLRWPKFYETLVLCLRSTKKFLKVKSIDIIANRSLKLYS